MGGMSVLSLGVLNSGINTGGALKYGNHNHLKGFFSTVIAVIGAVWGAKPQAPRATRLARGGIFG
jgi:hypothetical protein